MYPNNYFYTLLTKIPIMYVDKNVSRSKQFRHGVFIEVRDQIASEKLEV